jgi:diketogulonate reductase-like aldo/keto reductase
VDYCHIGRTAVYDNGTEIREVLKENVDPDKMPWQELFMTSKLWNTSHHPKYMKGTPWKTLADLQLAYLDLYQMHWPHVFQ